MTSSANSAESLDDSIPGHFIEAVKIIGEISGLVEALQFEAALLPERCGNETVVRYGEWCSCHADCGNSTYGHPNSCLLGELATGQRRSADAVAKRLLCNSSERFAQAKQVLSEAASSAGDLQKACHEIELMRFLGGRKSDYQTLYQGLAKRCLSVAAQLEGIGLALSQTCDGVVAVSVFSIFPVRGRFATVSTDAKGNDHINGVDPPHTVMKEFPCKKTTADQTRQVCFIGERLRDIAQRLEILAMNGQHCVRSNLVKLAASRAREVGASTPTVAWVCLCVILAVGSAHALTR